MKKLKTIVITTSRADYGLLTPLLKKLNEDSFFDLGLIVTGSHLSDLYGKTIEAIRKDGFPIEGIVDMLVEGDTERDICTSMSKGIQGFLGILENKMPDLVIVLGDRYELWPFCISSVISKIPIAHIHGGEATQGVIDDSIRHSVTKMAAIHFPSIEVYGRRIIQMGESPEQVYTVGALGIDNIKAMNLMDKAELSEFAGVDFNKAVCLMTYHPVTLDDYNSAAFQIKTVLEALSETDLDVLVTMPNSDTGGSLIYQKIQEYIQISPQKFHLVKSLGQKAYLSAMKYSKLMLGNSSSGIIESASFKLPVVNIGDRQTGRFKPANIIDCNCTKASILQAINKTLSKEFTASISDLQNPYGDGNTAAKIVNVLKSIDFSDKSKLLKKGFYDLNSSDLEQISKQRIII